MNINKKREIEAAQAQGDNGRMPEKRCETCGALLSGKGTIGCYRCERWHLHDELKEKYRKKREIKNDTF